MSETMEIEESNEPKTPIYEIGDTVLCFSRNDLYVARVFVPFFSLIIVK